MTFEYRDHDGDFIEVSIPFDLPYIALRTSDRGCYVHPDRVEEVVAGIRDAARTAARQTTGQADTAVTCAHCKGTGADPEDQGDYEPSVHMYNPTTIGPCPECHGSGKDAPAVGQPAEAHDTDRAEPLVHVGWWCWRGNDHGHLAEMACRSDNVPIHVPAEWADEMRAVVQHLTDGHEPGQDCTWVTPEEQAAETQAAADTVEDER